MTKTIIYVANRGYALKKSRSRLIQHFLAQGWQVVLATADDQESRELCRLGASLDPVYFLRNTVKPWSELEAFWRLEKVFERWRPKIIHNFHAKPMMLSTLAGRRRLGKRTFIVNTITGLGRTITHQGPTRWMSALGYKLSGRRSNVVVFQNKDDREYFLDRGWVTESRAELIVGSGVDVNHYKRNREHYDENRSKKVVMVGRLLKQKGIIEFSMVAKRIRAEWPEVVFYLAGEVEPRNPDGVSEKWLSNQPEVKYLGRVEDIRLILTDADVFLYPSYYREGVPRVVMEASASGVPTVGFDVPGVREVVRDGETGFLVPAGDVDALVKKVRMLLDDLSLRENMSGAARRLMEESFDERHIMDQYLNIYRRAGLKGY